jgi:hypothetical protein
MVRVYFDTNVYDHIDKDDVPMTDLDALRSALANRKLVANLSIADVEELLGQWETNRPAAIRKLQLARDLVGFHQMLKQPSDLLADAFKAYAAGEAAASYLMPPNQRHVVVSSLHSVIQGDTKLDRVVSESLEKVRLMIKGFRQMMTESRAEVLAQWKIIVANLGRNPTFQEYWKAGAIDFAEGLIPPDSLEGCRARGFDGLLEIRTVRLAVGALMSLIFSQIVGEGSQSRTPQRGDAHDLWHAILASVAEVFVTYDERLAASLSRVPVDGFRVFSSIPELLQSTLNER